MQIGWTLAPAAATLIVVVGMEAAVRAVDVGRAREFAVRDNGAREQLARRYPLPAVKRSPLTDRVHALSALLRATHRTAIKAQAAYLAALVRATSCLIMAFFALALAATPLLAHPLIGPLLAWLDAIAIALVIVHFVRGRGANRQWIRLRVEAELLRLYEFLSLLFPSPRSPSQPHDLTSEFEREGGRIRQAVLAGQSHSEIALRLDEFWSVRRRQIEHRSLSAADLNAEALLLYMHARPMRQLCWFTDSKFRLERKAEKRMRRLLILYWVAIVLACLKLGIVLTGMHGPHQALSDTEGVGMLAHSLLPALLVVTGWSAAETAYYVNQNARSLIHQYNSQQRRIGRWLTAFEETLPLSDLPNAEFTEPLKNAIRALVLRFEDLMVEELLDWTHVSGSDVIEIAP